MRTIKLPSKIITILTIFLLFALDFFNISPHRTIVVSEVRRHNVLTLPDRTNVTIKIESAGDPTTTANLAFCLAISRRKIFYAQHTLRWMLRLLPPNSNVIFIAMVLENEFYVKELQKQFWSEIKGGILEIISTSEDNYKQFNFMIHPKMNIVPIAKLSWQTKMNIDFIYLMEYCQKRAENCVWLEDDVIPARDYLEYIREWIDRLYSSEAKFSFISFCRYGSVAKIPNKKIMSNILEYFYSKREKGPTDDMMHYYSGDHQLPILEQDEKFDHYGFSSTYGFKVQQLRNKIKDSALVDIPVKSCLYSSPGASIDCINSIGFDGVAKMKIQDIVLVQNGIFRIIFEADVFVERVLMVVRDRHDFEVPLVSQIDLSVKGLSRDQVLFFFEDKQQIDCFPGVETGELVFETLPETSTSYQVSFELLKWWAD